MAFDQPVRFPDVDFIYDQLAVGSSLFGFFFGYKPAGPEIQRVQRGDAHVRVIVQRQPFQLENNRLAAEIQRPQFAQSLRLTRRVPAFQFVHQLAQRFLHGQFGHGVSFSMQTLKTPFGRG
ncbi:MAG: hypothetical protein DWB59_08870 [Anaerolineae bacterium]|nr:hypothetical protein [Anaerolineae bacterium]